MALANDPRIQKFKDDDKAQKERKKLKAKQQKEARLLAIRQAELDRQREADERRERLKREEEEKQRQREKAEQEKQDVVDAIVQVLTTKLQYLSKTPLSSMDQRIFENRILEAVKGKTDMSVLYEYRDKLVEAAESGERQDLEELAREHAKFLTSARRKLKPGGDGATSSNSSSPKPSRPWTAEEIKAVIAGANKIPGGTQERWEKISKFVAHETGQPARRNDEVIDMCKMVKKGKGDVTGVLQQLQTERKALGKQLGDEAPTTVQASGGDAWTAAQQQQLQKALKTYPPGYQGQDRWDRIAAMVEGKSKKDCVLRVKVGYLSRPTRRHSFRC